MKTGRRAHRRGSGPQGLRVTPQRQAIFRLLARRRHATRRSSRSTRRPAPRCRRSRCKTVYQTVHDLEAMGEVELLDVGTGSVRVDPNVEHAHHHLVCTRCGTVRDVLVDVADLRVPAALPPRASRSTAVEVVLPRRVRRVPAASPSTPDARSPPIHVRTNDTPEGEQRMPDLERNQDPRQPQGSVRGREPGQPPVPLLRAEGRRRGLPRRRRAVPLGRRG